MVQESTHTSNHTLDLVLIYGNEIDHFKVPAQNLLSSFVDNFLLTSEFLLINYKPRVTSYYSRCVSEDTVETFKEVIPSSMAI